MLEALVVVHGCPLAIRVDYGPEFTAQPFVDWCTGHGVAIHYIQPGKPDQNAYIERFNRTYRTEVLNAHLFDRSLVYKRSPMRGSPSTNRSAARQPRPGAAPDLSAEAFEDCDKGSATEPLVVPTGLEQEPRLLRTRFDRREL